MTRPTYDEHVRQCGPDPRPGAWPRLEFEAMQTGRTYRMMEAARAASSQGLAVSIVVFSLDYARDLRRIWRTGEWPTTVVFFTLDTAPFGVGDREKIEAAHPHRRIFISHDAIEQRYNRLLTELHRFDGKLPWDN